VANLAKLGSDNAGPKAPIPTPHSNGNTTWDPNADACNSVDTTATFPDPPGAGPEPPPPGDVEGEDDGKEGEDGEDGAEESDGVDDGAAVPAPAAGDDDGEAADGEDEDAPDDAVAVALAPPPVVSPVGLFVPDPLPPDSTCKPLAFWEPLRSSVARATSEATASPAVATMATARRTFFLVIDGPVPPAPRTPAGPN
jgi:hypothetical protein